MKRYRIFSFDFDSRALILQNILNKNESAYTESDLQSLKNIVQQIKLEYGEHNLELKIDHFLELKSKPFSILAFHNEFMEQIRSAYIQGNYYPALTGACSLGERILNHLTLLLRDYHKDTDEYKKLYRKESFDYWPLVIDALRNWDELLPEAAEKFKILHEKRNFCLHFNKDVENNTKSHAIEAIHLMQDIIKEQFSAFGTQPWYFCIPGEIYIKKEWEDKPLIKHLFIPNAIYVGPKHRVKNIIPSLSIEDEDLDDSVEITDQEYINIRRPS